MKSEIEELVSELNSIRGQILEAVKGLEDTAANWHPLPRETNSIYNIISHIIGAQNGWVRRVIGGEEIRRDRESELRAAGPLAELVGRFQEESDEIEAILGKLTASQLSESRQIPLNPPGKASVRWCILHVLTHNATHLGHIQLNRQLWEQKPHG